MNKLGDLELVGLCVAGIVAVIAIYAIISLIVDYRQEAKKSNEMVSNLQMANNMPIECVDVSQGYNYDSSSSSRHFKDTGKPYGDYTGASTRLYEGFQFVIVKSVIHTETREEID